MANQRMFVSHGAHSHRCHCGNAWSHTDCNAGDIEEHTCATCGRVVWSRFSHVRPIKLASTGAFVCGSALEQFAGHAPAFAVCAVMLIGAHVVLWCMAD